VVREMEEDDPTKVYMKDFKIIKELGKGGFGQVFLVELSN
jgi:serine/threonine protein kinase